MITAVNKVMKPSLPPGFFLSWKLVVEWIGFHPCGTTTASHFQQHPYGSAQTLGTKEASVLYASTLSKKAPFAADERCIRHEMLQSCTTHVIPF